MFLNECLDSVISQETDGFKTELILVDDHSTDKSRDIALEYAEKNANVLALCNVGNGIIDALETGFAASLGAYITRMDADDIMPPKKLQALYDMLQTPSCDVATGKVKYFRNDGVELGNGYQKYEQWLNSLVDSETFYQDIYRECTVASPNWMMTRNAFLSCGGFSGDYPEDYDLVFRWYASKLKIRGVDQVSHLWRDHSNRASRNDANYLDNRFLELKMKCFLKLDYQNEKELKVLGAGKKGKQLAKKLISHNIPFSWYTNNPSKIAHDIYGKILISDQELLSRSNPFQVIVAIAGPDDKNEIMNRFYKAQLKQGIDFFLFS